MVEEQMVRVNEAMSKMLEDIDKAHLRQLQAKMYRCAAECCDDKVSSMTRVHECIENCGFKLKKAEQYVQDEFNHMQGRLKRCIMSCNDSIMDNMGPKASDTEVARYTKEFESCASKCVDSHIDLLPNLLKKMKEFLS